MDSTFTMKTEGIFISYQSFLLVALLLLSIGALVGFHVCKNWAKPCASCEYDWDNCAAGEHSLQKSDCGETNDSSSHSTQKLQDGPTEVLMGSLNLLSSLWQSDMSETKVVNYLSPDQMHRLLFTGSNSLRLGDTCDENSVTSDSKSSPRSSAADISRSDPINNKNNLLVNTNLSSANFLQLLSSLQKYSVNTSHPYFFNQLFGSLDPIALAAEIVALSVNTSVYTYETAPVFTLLEREVMRNIGNLVFGQEDKEFEGEGLMIPGGSLANLTAMHAARHRWKVRNGFIKSKDENSLQLRVEDEVEEEKKLDDILALDDDSNLRNHQQISMLECDSEEPALVAFVSSEAHYSFSKSARVLGIRDEDLIVIPTHEDGRMDVSELAKCIEELEHELENESSPSQRKRVPFFVACTSGSTVRGSFDDIASIVQVCRQYESRGTSSLQTSATNYQRTIWVHVDGAWGGSAIFSSRASVRTITHMDEVRHADSFTFNPHKMLGAPQQTTAFIVRHHNALKNANAAGAKYLFDPRKNGAEYDLGDLSYTCGRRTDAVKLWAMWKYYGKEGLGARVDQKVDELQLFVKELSKRPSFALACRPWLFNVNFFYFPPRIRDLLRSRGLQDSGVANDNSFIQIPDDISQDLANVSVTLKLRLHEAGEMIIPYQVRHFYLCSSLATFVLTDIHSICNQPLNNQRADCFRLVLAGKKKFDVGDISHVLDMMEKYGEDL
jgi:glutamate/tyrosine decarboxylase-like PLP-dependent enzyme